MKKYPLLDIFRIVCACLVALIHKGASEGSFASMLITCFARQAVPFFFIVSGFFFVQKLDRTENKKTFVLSYARQLFIFYMVWIIFQIPQLLNDYVPLLQDTHWMYIVMVLARRILLAGTAPFWYLLALAETALIAGLLLIRRKEKLLYWIGGIGLLLGYLYSLEIPLAVFELFQKLVYTVFSWNNNFIMSGIPFFAIGVYFAKERDRITVDLGKAVCAYLAVSVVNVLSFYANLELDKYLYLCVPQAAALFLIGIGTRYVPIRSEICHTCRMLSSAIYCLHLFVIIYVMGNIIPWTGSFSLNFALIILVCVLIYYLVKITKIKALYRLITLK